MANLSKLAKFYAMQVKLHKITIDEVPERLQDAVKALLEADA